MQPNERNGVQHQPAPFIVPAMPVTADSNRPVVQLVMPPRRKKPTDKQVRDEILRLLGEAPRQAAELLGLLKRSMVLDEYRYMAIRSDMVREGLIRNMGNVSSHKWLLGDGSTPAPPTFPPVPMAEPLVSAPAQPSPLPQAKPFQASTVAKATENHAFMEVIAEQSVEIRELRRQLQEARSRS